MREIPTAFSIIILILIMLFRQIKKPLITIICALLALSGANFGLFITGSYFGFMTFLGYICLVGIAVNNCVIFLESLNDKQDEPLNDALNAAPDIKFDKIKIMVKNTAISRVTPVFLTAVTTIGGMLPLWIGNDPMFSSLAIAIIFGLLASVFITLLAAPALYLILEKY